jgi:hypothetical protein
MKVFIYQVCINDLETIILYKSVACPTKNMKFLMLRYNFVEYIYIYIYIYIYVCVCICVIRPYFIKKDGGVLAV